MTRAITLPGGWTQVLEPWRQHLARQASTPDRASAQILTIEGPDRTGKSTLVRRLAAELQGEGREVLAIGEPGNFMGEESKLLKLPGAAALIEAARRARLDLIEQQPDQRPGPVLEPAAAALGQRRQLETFERSRRAMWNLQESWLAEHPGGIILRDRSWPSSLVHQPLACCQVGLMTPAQHGLEQLDKAREQVLILRTEPRSGAEHASLVTDLQPAENQAPDLDFSSDETPRAYRLLGEQLNFSFEPDDHEQLRGEALSAARRRWARLHLQASPLHSNVQVG